MIDSSVPISSVTGLEHNQPNMSTLWGNGGWSKINNKKGINSGNIQAMRNSHYFSVKYIGDKLHHPIFHQHLIPVSVLSAVKEVKQHNPYMW